MLKNAISLKKIICQVKQAKDLIILKTKTKQTHLGKTLFSNIFYQFSAVSWKKFMETYDQTKLNYEQYSISNVNPRIQTQLLTLLIYPFSPTIQSKEPGQYFIDKNPLNFLLSFLGKSPQISSQLLWKNKKDIGLSSKDILMLEKYKGNEDQIKITKVKYMQNNMEIIKILTISSASNTKIQEQPNKVMIKLQLFLKGPEKTLLQSEDQVIISENEYFQFILGAKKQIYNLSGMKTLIQMQRMKMIEDLNKKVTKDQLKISPISTTLDIVD